MRKNNVYRLSLSALFLALALVLPFLTGQLPQLGSALLPMHLPVLLCGFLCGWPWGLAVGFISPLLRTLLFGMPPVMPTAVAMAFELAAYGAFSGLLYSRLKVKGSARTYIALAVAMLLGRAVWGVVSFALYSLFLSKVFTAAMFVAGAFVTAWPGILAQLVLVPAIILALEKAKLFTSAAEKAPGKAA